MPNIKPYTELTPASILVRMVDELRHETRDTGASVEIDETDSVLAIRIVDDEQSWPIQALIHRSRDRAAGVELKKLDVYKKENRETPFIFMTPSLHTYAQHYNPEEWNAVGIENTLMTAAIEIVVSVVNNLSTLQESRMTPRSVVYGAHPKVAVALGPVIHAHDMLGRATILAIAHPYISETYYLMESVQRSIRETADKAEEKLVDVLMDVLLEGKPVIVNPAMLKAAKDVVAEKENTLDICENAAVKEEDADVEQLRRIDIAQQELSDAQMELMELQCHSPVVRPHVKIGPNVIQIPQSRKLH